MKLPRNLTGTQLIKALGQLGYQSTRQAGSHVRLTCKLPIEHPLTDPLHDPLQISTLACILGDVATHHNATKDDVIRKLSGK